MRGLEKNEVLVVIPAYNEENNIGNVVERVVASGFTEVLVVDDGSSDDTPEIARRKGALVVSHPINRGSGAATQTGLVYCRGKSYKALATIDADGQHAPEDLEKLMDKLMESNADMVIGSRFLAKENLIPEAVRFYNKIANIITFIFAMHRVSDSQSGLKLLSRKAVEKMDIRLDGYEFCTEMIIEARRANLKIEEASVSISYTPETLKKGQGLKNGIITAFNLVDNFFFQRTKR